MVDPVSQGNEFYKAGNYVSASKEYAAAVFLYPEPNYCSNWAAAMLKLEL